MLGENFSAPFVIIWKRRKIGRESKFFFSKLVKNLSISNDDTKNLKVFFKFTKNIRRFEAKQNSRFDRRSRCYLLSLRIRSLSLSERNV